MGRRLNLLAVSVLFLFSASAVAQEERYMRLSRISYLEGNVSYQRMPDVDWSAASINMPLEPGDRIYTGPNGRTEIEFDDDSVLRLAENTDVEIVSLNEDVVQLRMLVGLASLVVASDADYEINTPAAAFSSVRKGNYRFEVSENGDTDAIVRKGRIEAQNNLFSRNIDSGLRLRVRAVDDGNHAVARYEQIDSWDQWNDRRTIDRRASTSRRYLPGTVNMGAAELDQYGRWVNVSGYGAAWVPFSVDVYWSPYSVGRWCYRPYYGWTWVSYEPWGWLPYHYGRWYQSASFGWCWLPGPGFSFNFWSPGLVAFYSGPGWVSWLPLGPGDYYNVNHYHYNRGIYSYQMDRLRSLHTRSQGDCYNRNARGAFRTVQIDHFKNGSFNERSANTRWGNIDHPWREGNLVRDRLDIRPTATSYRAAPDRNASRPRGNEERHVVERTGSRGDRRTESRTAAPGEDRRFARTETQMPVRTTDRRETRTENGTTARTEERRAVERDAQTPARTATRSESRWETRTSPQNEDRGAVPSGASSQPRTGTRTESQTQSRESQRRDTDSPAPQSPSRWEYQAPAAASDVPTPARNEDRGIVPSGAPSQPRTGTRTESQTQSRESQQRDTTPPAPQSLSRWVYRAPAAASEARTPIRNEDRGFVREDAPSQPRTGTRNEFQTTTRTEARITSGRNFTSPPQRQTARPEYQAPAAASEIQSRRESSPKLSYGSSGQRSSSSRMSSAAPSPVRVERAAPSQGRSDSSSGADKGSSGGSRNRRK